MRAGCSTGGARARRCDQHGAQNGRHHRWGWLVRHQEAAAAELHRCQPCWLPLHQIREHTRQECRASSQSCPHRFIAASACVHDARCARFREFENRTQPEGWNWPHFAQTLVHAGHVKTADYVAQQFIAVIENVGPEHVTAVTTDNAANCKAAGQIIQVGAPCLTFAALCPHFICVWLRKSRTKRDAHVHSFCDSLPCLGKKNILGSMVQKCKRLPRNFVSYHFQFEF